MYYNIFSSKVKYFHQFNTYPQLFTENYPKYYVNRLSKYVVFYGTDAQYMVK